MYWGIPLLYSIKMNSFLEKFESQLKLFWILFLKNAEDSIIFLLNKHFATFSMHNSSGNAHVLEWYFRARTHNHGAAIIIIAYGVPIG